LQKKTNTSSGLNTHPIFAARAKGATITDVEGKEYIDFAGGIGVANAGHCDEEVVKAVKDQVEKYIHTCFHVVMYEPYVELAKRLNEITPGSFPKKTMFAKWPRPLRMQSRCCYAAGKPGQHAFEDVFMVGRLDEPTER
jgi:4-aminobutyrate aminotransferase/(S)-3-amino-2-methylpropionate transaminase